MAQPNTAIPADVSVVIPTHDRPALLAEAIRSVFRQTHPPREIIVVDDLSSTATQELVESVSREGRTPLRYLPTVASHRTAGESRNTGARQASGTFLAFLDDDDTWRQDHLALLAGAMAADVSLVASWTRYVRDGTSTRGMRLPPGIAADTMSYTHNPGFTGSNFLIRSAAFEQVGGFDPRLRVANDLDLFLRLMHQGIAYAVVREETVRQRAHDLGQLSARTMARAEGLQMFRAKYAHCMSTGDHRYIQRQYHSVMRHCAGSATQRRTHLFLQATTYSPADYVRLIGRFSSGQHHIWRAPGGAVP
jgi:glycosyltransferase involved in cell wall biosynthesis